MSTETNIYRDIKPENSLLNSNGVVKLCDFGQLVQAEDSLHKTAVGTTIYMAPERLRGQTYGGLSDVWSFGSVLLQCLTGHSPPWTNVQSIVDLLVTVEDMDPEHEIISQACEGKSEHVVNVLVGCLQHNCGE